MNHQDPSADPPGTGSRKTAFHYRRGSSGASASTATDDNPGQAGSNSPGPHQQPQSQAASAQQVKKKSGFQITSVTSAQINVSGNNSLADDTESYDDMDESHTEDLSSSDMLDVSVSRATDTGVPERSSSDETLNSLHGVDTPGMVSPNEPLRPHSVGQGSQQNTSMVNGAVHHHHYYLQQQNQPHHHLSDSLGGGESSVAALPVAPVRSSSPSVASRAANSQTQRPSMLESCEPLPAVVGAVADPQLNISNVSAAAAVPPPGPAGLDNVAATGHAASVGGGTGPSAAALSTQSQHTQTATGSRFRVVKLDTNSEPFRKGRWTCTDYYEKEVPHATTSEAPKSVEVAMETDPGNVLISQGTPAVQPPHTLQSYQQPSLDFTSPQAMQSPPQGLAQTAPVTYVSPHEVVGGAYLQQHVAPAALPTAPPQTGVNQPPAVVPQQLPYTLDPQPAQPQGGYSAPQLHAGVIGQGGVRQPDFIQPTAPFQTQVQPPLPHVQMEISISPVPGITAPTSFTQQGLVAPPGQASFLGPPKTLPTQPQPQAQPPSTARFPAALAHGTHYTPLTALQADLQPLLTHGATLPQVPGGGSSIRTSQLEDAGFSLGLLGFPRLGMTAGMEVGGAAGSLAHMAMSAEASAFMVAAAAGLRTQHAEGDEDSSSGASVVAIDNKIEQAMDLVKSHLMYAVREEVEVLKEQIKELIERNTQLEQENNLLKNLASPEQMAQFQAQVQTGGSPTGTAQPPVPGPVPVGTGQAPPPSQSSGTSA
uniref:TSC22 domain family protein 1-like n=1 Tax=Gasterosteus aculeatus aculeatus TaxID=481459 RepID=UPI001A97DF91|nr:TSC22 domain family protein 1-like [Gasterosteus aculeatus aculeatus]